ncbi:hypothetical protein EAI83_16815, partial [Blautia sp. aa_0143]
FDTQFSTCIKFSMFFQFSLDFLFAGLIEVKKYILYRTLNKISLLFQDMLPNCHMETHLQICTMFS